MSTPELEVGQEWRDPYRSKTVTLAKLTPNRVSYKGRDGVPQSMNTSVFRRLFPEFVSRGSNRIEMGDTHAALQRVMDNYFTNPNYQYTHPGWAPSWGGAYLKPQPKRREPEGLILDLIDGLVGVIYAFDRAETPEIVEKRIDACLALMSDLDQSASSYGYNWSNTLADGSENHFRLENIYHRIREARGRHSKKSSIA